MANWFKKATSKNKGAFGRQAKRAGMSTGAFARKVKGAPKGKYSATTVKRANLASTLGKLRKRA